MAMSMQKQQAAQMPQGDFAAMAAAMATPGKKGPAEPGISPGAKRPLSRETFIRQTVDIPKPMDMSELNAGFHNLMALQTRDEGYAKSIAGCTAHNARTARGGGCVFRLRSTATNAHDPFCVFV